MAVVCSAAKVGQIGQRMMRVVGLRTISEAVRARSQWSAGVSNAVPTTTFWWEGFGATSPAWWRDAFSDRQAFLRWIQLDCEFKRFTVRGHSRAFATKRGADSMTGAGKTSATSGDSGHEMRVNTMVRDELDEPEHGPERGLKGKAKQAVAKVGEKVKDAGTAVKGSTDSKVADKVGETAEQVGGKLKEEGTTRTSLRKEDVVTS